MTKTRVLVERTPAKIRIERAKIGASKNHIMFSYAVLPTKRFTHPDGTVTTYVWTPTQSEWVETK